MDTGYKQLFAHPEMVRDLLRGFTPFWQFRHLDLAQLERVNASYVSDEFSERHDDIVWRVRLGDHWLYVYILVEFQSRPDRWMALRVHVYIGLLYQDLVKRHEVSPDATLPPVLPLVLYNGVAPWRASTELSGLLMDAPRALAGYQARQRYLLIDQHRMSTAKLEAMRKNLVACVIQMELSASPDVTLDIVATLAVWINDEARAPLRRSLGLWAYNLVQRKFKLPRDQLGDAMKGDANMGERYKYQHEYDYWSDMYHDRGLAEGRLEGREQGRKEGFEAGERETLRAVLRRQLHKRFGELPAAMLSRVESAQTTDLERWLDRSFESADPIDVFR